MPLAFHPDFDEFCRVCNTRPCVVVDGHPEPNTELCGPCFFGTAKMLDWELWNEFEDESDE